VVACDQISSTTSGHKFDQVVTNSHLLIGPFT
jgi:hypothetical protein